MEKGLFVFRTSEADFCSSSPRRARQHRGYPWMGLGRAGADLCPMPWMHTVLLEQLHVCVRVPQKPLVAADSAARRHELGVQLVTAFS